MPATATAPITLHAHEGRLYAAWEKPVPKWVRRFFILFIATLPLETMQIEGLTSDMFTISKLAGYGFFLSYLLHMGFPFRFTLPRIPAALWFFSIYLVIFAYTAMVGEFEGVRSYLIRIFSLVQLFCLFWFGADLLRSPAIAKHALLGLAVACGLVAAATLLGMPGFQQEASGRLTALGESPNHLSALMGYAAIIILGFCMREHNWSGLRKLSLLSLMLPLFAVMIATGSRAGIGAFIIGTTFFFLPHKGSKKQIMAFSLAFAAVVGVAYMLMRDPVASERLTETIQEGKTAGRGEIYSAALEMVSEKPIVGWGGRDAFRELGFRLGMDRGVDAHNLILYLLLEVGLLGALPFMFALWLCAREAWRGRDGTFGLMPLALLMALMAYNMTHTGILLKITWLLLAFTVAASANGRDTVYRRVASISNESPAPAKGSLRPAPALRNP